MFGLWRLWRRRRLAKGELPEAWLEYLQAHVPFFAELDARLRARFLRYLKIFIGEKHFISGGEMVITDEVRVVIAAAAVRLILHLDPGYYDRLTEIVVYPSHVRAAGDDAIIFGAAHGPGTVVLSWEAVLHGLENRKDGHDTAAHEFAHILDRADGAFDGTPELRSLGHYQPWAEVMSQHFLRLRRGRRAERKVLRAYARQDEAEFFAVATEAFFEKPQQMKKRLPELYGVLKRFYGFDPAEPPRKPDAVVTPDRGAV